MGGEVTHVAGALAFPVMTGIYMDQWKLILCDQYPMSHQIGFCKAGLLVGNKCYLIEMLL